MTTEATFTWIALPARRGPIGRLELSVFVAPRLRSDASAPTLADFPDLVDWPERDISFAVQFGGSAPGEGVTVPAVRASAAPDLDVWQAILPPDTPVVPFEFEPLDQIPIHSYSISRLNTFLKERYARFGRDAETPPSAQELASAFEAAGAPDLSNRGQPSPLDVVRGRLHREKVVDGSDDDTLNFALLADFHDRGQRPHGKSRDGDSFPLAPGRLDVHQILSLAGEHPALLRRLGLVIDLHVAAPRTVSGDVAVRVIPRWDPRLDATQQGSPATLATVEIFDFYTRSRRADSPVERQHLALGREDLFEVVQVDPDGSGLKLRGLSRTLARKAEHPGAGQPTEPGAPSLRTAGLQLVRKRRAGAFHQQLVETTSMNDAIESADSKAVLGAEDLMRGIRPDVWDEVSGAWRSLVARDTTYRFTDSAAEAFTVRDEGMVATTPSGAADGDRAKGLWLGEAVLSWSGWSLTAPRPGLPMSKDEFPGDDGYPEVENTPAPGLAVSMSSKAVPGSLPPLRYGRSYRFRARIVDLAGNGPSLQGGADDDSVTTEPDVFSRFEPVAAPVVIPRAPSTEGEQVDVLVIRSSEYEAPGEITERSERHVAPPKTSQLEAERHGVLDRDDGSPDPETWMLVATKESNTFDEVFELDPSTGRVTPHEHGELDHARPGWRYHPGEHVELPYLPDPIASGLALTGVPGTAAEPQLFRFDRSDGWHRVPPFRLELSAGNGAPVRADGVYRVFLPPASKAVMHMSSTIGRADAERMGQTRWISEEGTEPAPGTVSGLAATGQAWQLTPRRRITLVHAVRQPLEAPRDGSFSARRTGLGHTYATLTGALDFSRRSTGRVELVASWTDPVDDGPGTPTPSERQVVDASAASIPLDRRDRDFQLSDSLPLHSDRHELGDTKRRAIAYRAIATTAFADYFTKRGEIMLADGTATLPHLGQGVVPGSVTLSSIDGATSYRDGTDFTVDRESGQVSGVEGGTLPSDGSVRASWQAAPVTRESDPLVRDVASSARPPAPGLRYAVPSFLWTKDRSLLGDRLVSSRRGRTLRVFLDRPWFASGAGELLGVVLWPAAQAGDEPPESLRQSTTTWAADPTVSGPGPAGYGPDASMFPLADPDHVGTGLELPEAGGQHGPRVDVVGHVPVFDDTRDLWYCDIELATAAFQPFIRLALARFQPHSVTGAHLSPVVMTEWLQPAPDRTLTVTRNGSALTLSLTGPAATARDGVKGPGWATVQVERQVRSGDAGWEAVGRASRLQVRPVRGGDPIWQGTVSVPKGMARHRLVVEQGDEVPTSPHSTSLLADSTTRRLIHQDIVGLPI